MQILGIIGNACLALCAVPQAIKCFKTQKAEGLSFWFLVLWYVGEICTLFYVIDLMNFLLFMNYFVNVVCLSIIIAVKVKNEIQSRNLRR
jgi:uncharacterized protein with PQ loop repeat